MAEIDTRVSAALSREARVVGRLRLAARGCASLSVGLVVVRHAEDDDGIDGFMITGDDPSRAPRTGPRGEERRNAPWAPNADLDRRGSCDSDAAPEVHFFRAQHGPDHSVEQIHLENLDVEACGFYGHDLRHGDLDGDGTTEVRVETRTGGWQEMSAGTDRSHRLFIFDLASFRAQLALELGYERAPECGLDYEDLSGVMSLRDLDGDEHRDVVVRQHLEGRDSHFSPAEYQDWRTNVWRYDASADGYVRAEELDSTVRGRSPDMGE
ncbi:MAG: hypothetical protein RLO52_03435 [Sandaracinaceae bacterium]|nr:MAG: hypothetical protein EVA89_04185 [Sandaracinaceae bacterium]